MATVQMNIRIDKELKAAGDAALKEAGYTPTQIINLLWKYLAENKNNKKKIEEFFDLIDPERHLKERNHVGLINKLAKSNTNFEEYCKQN